MDAVLDRLKVPQNQRQSVGQLLARNNDHFSTRAGRPLTLSEQVAIGKNLLGIQRDTANYRSIATFTAIAAVIFVPYRRWPRGLRVLKPETISRRPFLRLEAGSPPAIALWHTLRQTVQVFAFATVGGSLAWPAAALKASLGMSRDPELQGLVGDMQGRLKEGLRNPGQAQQQRPVTGQRWGEEAEGKSQAYGFERQRGGEEESRLVQEARKAAQDAYRKKPSSYDDASPSAEDGSWPEYGAQTSESSDRAYRTTPSVDDDWRGSTYTSSDSAPSEDLYDDASPTAPEARQGESSWDRLRRQAEAEQRGQRPGSESKGGSKDKGDDEKWW
jgi:hypothetical protein